MMDVISWRVLRRGAAIALAREADLRVEGLEHVPRRGPVLIAARHYHHLLDGCALIRTVDRPSHIVVGLDWAGNRLLRRAMDALCRAARWPVVERPEHPDQPRPKRGGDGRDRRAVLRSSARDTTALLREGRVVVVFPEGYPNIDPSFTPKRGDEFLPFQPGFLSFVRMAQRTGTGPVPVVPAGFAYERAEENGDGRWRITLRFGPPVMVTDAVVGGVDAVERAVRDLSQPG
jgi:putative membrane protein